MKDSEFIELLNLYLDHEISAADAARLEAEVQTNPARRSIYQDYCRMQKACKIIAADFVTEEVPAAASDRKVVSFNAELAPSHTGARRRAGLIAFGGFAAAAACVALVFVGRGRSGAEQQGTAPSPTFAQATTPAPAAETKAVEVASMSAAPRGFAPVPQRQHTILVSNPLSLAEQSQAEAIYAAAFRQADNQLAWMETLRLAPLPERKTQETDLRFQAHFPSESRALGGRVPVKHPEQAEEMAAFQFLK
jgi:hypothetical protein